MNNLELEVLANEHLWNMRAKLEANPNVSFEEYHRLCMIESGRLIAKHGAASAVSIVTRATELAQEKEELTPEQIDAEALKYISDAEALIVKHGPEVLMVLGHTLLTLPLVNKYGTETTTLIINRAGQLHRQ